MALKIADSARGVGASCGYMAPELRIERERSKLALDELMYFLEGEAYTNMKQNLRELLHGTIMGNYL